MQITSTAIPEVKEIRPVRHQDPRGFFAEIFRESTLREHGIDGAFVQENHSLSVERGVVRGLHFQSPPAAQAKLVRVAAGPILDVAVDIRRGSPSYGRHVAVVLSAAEGNQLFVPEGFAHGFCTIEPNTEVVYKVNRYYSREHDLGLAWNDPALEIDWGISADARHIVRQGPAPAVSRRAAGLFPLRLRAPAMKLLVLGAGGQLGRELCRLKWPSGFRIAAYDHARLDIAQRDPVFAAVARERPDIVINAAAYTAVDRAESEPDAAWAGNSGGPANLAAACNEAAIPLIHVSTDYVFDGAKTAPYREDDPVAPLGVYGASKDAGERAVRQALPQHVIVRTAWLYSAHGSNFVRTMLRLADERPVLRVVADQRGSPTSAAELAAALGGIAQQVAAGNTGWGTYHFAGAGSTTWHGFAEAIFELARPWRGPPPKVEAIATADYPTPARRPVNSVLDCTRIRDAFGIVPRPWQDLLAEIIREIYQTD